MNISNFFQWFLNQFIAIATNLIGKLDNITIYQNVTLLDFIITITIVGIFIEIILTLPNNANKLSSKLENKARKEKGK